jgi:hypothetical protein
MRPIKQVAHIAGNDYFDMMDECLCNGWVYSGEECCVGAVVADDEFLMEQNLNKDSSCWYVLFYAGDLKRVLELIPFGCDYVAFRRDYGRVRVYKMDSFIRKIRSL